MNAVVPGGAANDPGAPPCAAPDFAPRRPRWRLPARACDCHAHVLGPRARYPFSAQRVYTPPDCLAGAYREMLDTSGIERAVLVQPSVYGDDNSLLVDTLAGDPPRLRGVAVVAADVPEDELDRLHRAGVRGARVNLVDRREPSARLPLAELTTLSARIAPRGWHLELLVHVDEIADQMAELGRLPVPVVFGHFGYLTHGSGASDPGFRAMLALARTGRAWIKLTGPYRLTAQALPYRACDEMAAALRENALDRLVWGSDWPHVMLRGAMPNDGDLVDLIERWLPGASERQRVLVDNPQQLYDFPA